MRGMEQASHMLDDRARRVMRDAQRGEEEFAFRLLQLVCVLVGQPDELDRFAPAGRADAERIERPPQGSADQPLVKRRTEGRPPWQTGCARAKWAGRPLRCGPGRGQETPGRQARARSPEARRRSARSEECAALPERPALRAPATSRGHRQAARHCSRRKSRRRSRSGSARPPEGWRGPGGWCFG